MAEDFETFLEQGEYRLGAWHGHELGDLLDHYKALLSQDGVSCVLIFDSSTSFKGPSIELPLRHYLGRGRRADSVRKGYYTEKFMKPLDVIVEHQPLASPRLIHTVKRYGGGVGEIRYSEGLTVGGNEPEGRATEEPEPTPADSDAELEEIRRLLRESSALGDEIRDGINSLRERAG